MVSQIGVEGVRAVLDIIFAAPSLQHSFVLARRLRKYKPCAVIKGGIYSIIVFFPPQGVGPEFSFSHESSKCKFFPLLLNSKRFHGNVDYA